MKVERLLVFQGNTCHKDCVSVTVAVGICELPQSGSGVVCPAGGP